MTLNVDDLKAAIEDAVDRGQIDDAVTLADNLNDLQEAQQEKTDDSN
jgi:hypothetical protein